jgi:hypothetical protein
MNFAKQLHVGTIDEIAGLLWVYLKESARGGCLDARYARSLSELEASCKPFYLHLPAQFVSLETSNRHQQRIVSIHVIS